jgi:hypothetical protein
MAGKAGGRHRDEIALRAAPAATPKKQNQRNKTKETKQREETRCLQ